MLLRARVGGLILMLAPAATATAAVTAVTQHAAHADPWNCDASNMPCDGANSDYFTDPTADAPMWTDPIYDQSLGDPGDPVVDPAANPMVWDSGLGDPPGA